MGMTDLVTRLRELADRTEESRLRLGLTEYSAILREAADALERQQRHVQMACDTTDMVERECKECEQERDALKAKLADAEKRPTWAEWEALKDAHEQSWHEREGRWKAKLAVKEKEVLLPVVSHQCRTTHSACACVLQRLKKLEAAVEAARRFCEGRKKYDIEGYSKINALIDAIAALEEKP